MVSTHSRPKAAGKIKTLRHLYASVSTHSRPKAAGATVKANCRSWVRFNTQPPEGGWIDRAQQRRNRQRVSTHSRPKAAGCVWFSDVQRDGVSTHSRPKAAGSPAQQEIARKNVSTHSRPKAAGDVRIRINRRWLVSTHSRPKAAGRLSQSHANHLVWFQHTAARRRLG